MIVQTANKDKRSVSVGMDEFTILQHTETANSLESNRSTQELSFGEYAFDLVLDTIVENSNMILVLKDPLIVIKSHSLYDEGVSVSQSQPSS